MALPDSGALSLNQMHIEAGGTTETLASLNDEDIRALIEKTADTSMSFNEWYGASAGPPPPPPSTDLSYVDGGLVFATNNNLIAGADYTGSINIDVQEGDTIVCMWAVQTNNNPLQIFPVDINGVRATHGATNYSSYRNQAISYISAPSNASTVNVVINLDKRPTSSSFTAAQCAVASVAILRGGLASCTSATFTPVAAGDIYIGAAFSFFYLDGSAATPTLTIDPSQTAEISKSTNREARTDTGYFFINEGSVFVTASTNFGIVLGARFFVP